MAPFNPESLESDILGARILIVDDDIITRKLLRRVLEPAGFVVDESTSGEQAIERIQGSAPDLVLLDVLMDGIDGFSTCRQIKQLDGMGEVPIVFVTARLDSDSITEGLEAGGSDYISKPINRHEVQARVRKYLLIRAYIKKEVESAARGPDPASIGLDVGMHSLVDELLALPIADSEGAYLDLDPCDIAELVTGSVKICQFMANKKSITINYRSRGDIPKLMNLDKGRFRCLMENLLNRSLRLSPAQSVIDVSLSREGDQLILEISDPSSELSPAEVSALYTVDGANSHQSICRRIVHAHKGRISAKKDQAEPGLRTTIEFSLSDLGLPTL